ncbi:hypothetical protein KTO58_14385 [Chitinophaga pendula]|uniref:MG2 domain-containing protein n=1 Tax=Chitinophaga TaxID=79328 RepID=UPI000BB0C429|nr:MULTISPECIES: MG2 domain-containing protein [Chitinophaga]ASZ12072.1 hypothetical protein CK934_14440 [Chitinophaga sp. MD30]UCJ04890.1 hypothetical protein KTO58_14385 [Chitinophaga pendula]
MPQQRLLNRKRLQWLIPSLLLVLTGAFSYAPVEDWTDKIVKALEQFGKKYPQEKVYLHLDKDYYAAGETIWFKGYVTLDNLMALQARTMYVELLDKSGNIVQKKMTDVYAGTSAGDFEIPETLKAGVYRLRAYTSWMLNFDPEYLYYRDIEILDQTKKNAAATPVDTAQHKDFAIQFFPEGGQLIADAGNVVAFKATAPDGYPVDIAGVVESSKGKQIGKLITLHDGMGSLEFTPAPGETYQAIVQAANGGRKTVPLPAVMTTGASLKVYNKGSRIFYQAVMAHPEDTANNNLLIVAQMTNQLVYKARLNASEGKISGFIPTNMLPSGILQITLFGSNGLPLSERLAFVRQNDLLTMTLEAQQIDNEERAKNIVTLQLPDSMRASVSVSVTDADQVPKNIQNQNNIVSSLLLTSDIKGYVHNPAWYFGDSAAARSNALDLVMLTNGWRRFSWKKILANDYPGLPFSYEQGIVLKGTAFTNNGRYPLANGKVDLLIKQPIDSSTTFASAPTDVAGDFNIPNLAFVDTALIYYQGNDKDKRWKDVSVKFNAHFFDNRAPVKLPYPMRVPPPVDASLLKSFLTAVSDGNRVNRAINSRTVFLKEVNIIDRKPKPAESIDKKYTSGLFSGGDGYTFDLTKENPTAFNIFQYLQSKVAGLNITGNLSSPNLSWRGGAPTLYLNEMRVETDMLSTIPVSDVAMIKVFRPPFMGGFGGGANGAIAVYTKRGGEGGDATIRGFELYKKAGYALAKEFYSPDYAVRKEVHALPDKRLTLYWNAHVQIDTITNTAKIQFYNNDFSKHFRVVAEGMTAGGSVGHVEATY